MTVAMAYPALGADHRPHTKYNERCLYLLAQQDQPRRM